MITVVRRSSEDLVRRGMKWAIIIALSNPYQKREFTNADQHHDHPSLVWQSHPIVRTSAGESSQNRLADNLAASKIALGESCKLVPQSVHFGTKSESNFQSSRTTVLLKYGINSMAASPTFGAIAHPPSKFLHRAREQKKSETDKGALPTYRTGVSKALVCSPTHEEISQTNTFEDNQTHISSSARMEA